MSSLPTLLADRRHPLPDVQAEAPEHALALSRVGVHRMRLPLVFDSGPALATLTLSVDLPAEQRGAHMSRFRRAIDAVAPGLSPTAFARALAEELLVRHAYARTAEVELTLETALSDLVVPLSVRALAGMPWAETEPSAGVSLELHALGSTVCPCAYAMSGFRHAHVQRAELRARIEEPALGLEPLHRLLSGAFSAPVAMMLDRPAEKALVERMFAHPRFVEDVAREAIASLRAVRAGKALTLTATAFESIHPYDCFASWSGTL